MGATLRDNLRLAVQAQRAEDERIRAKMDAMPLPCVRHEDPAPYGVRLPVPPLDVAHDAEENGQTKRSDQTVNPHGQTKRSIQKDGPKQRSDHTVRPSSPPERSDQTVNADRPNGQTIRSDRMDSPNGQTVFLGKDRPLARTRQQQAVYGYLAGATDIVTSVNNLSEILTICPATLRKILAVFEQGGAIRKTRIGNDGLRIQFVGEKRSDHTVRPHGLTTRSDQNASLKIDRLKTLSISAETIGLTWPSLARAGFGPEQYEQILANLAAVGKPTDRVTQGLDHIEYELASGQLTDKTGQPVADPCSWAFRALAQNGYYRRPKGYVSPEEQAERDAAAEAQALAQSREQAREARFQAWAKGLSAADRQSALEGKQGPEEAWLKNVWRQRGEPE